MLLSKATIAWDFSTLLRIKQGDAIRNRISDFGKRRRLLIAAAFNFEHPVEKDS